jgi:hypothetical protein
VTEKDRLINDMVNAILELDSVSAESRVVELENLVADFYGIAYDDGYQEAAISAPSCVR